MHLFWLSLQNHPKLQLKKSRNATPSPLLPSAPLFSSLSPKIAVKINHRITGTSAVCLAPPVLPPHPFWWPGQRFEPRFWDFPRCYAAWTPSTPTEVVVLAWERKPSRVCFFRGGFERWVSGVAFFWRGDWWECQVLWKTEGGEGWKKVAVFSWG